MKHVLFGLSLLLAMQDGSARVERLPDEGKRAVEEPVKATLTPSAGASPAAVRPLSKRVVEEPLKLALKRSSGFGPGELPPLADAVKPGDVRWHATYADALAAAEASGKPALLFQLLGRLDAGFC
jgi:hypothetical protein